MLAFIQVFAVRTIQIKERVFIRQVKQFIKALQFFYRENHKPGTNGGRFSWLNVTKFLKNILQINLKMMLAVTIALMK